MENRSAQIYCESQRKDHKKNKLNDDSDPIVEEEFNEDDGNDFE